MNDQLQSTIESVSGSTSKITAFIMKYKYTIVFAVASGAVLLALMQSRNFLSPPRNEARYEEEILKINTSSINQEVVLEISKTLDDPNVIVNPDLVPGRSNPFTE